MTDRKFYRTVLLVEYISKKPTKSSLNTFHPETYLIDSVGLVTPIVQDEELTGLQAAMYLQMQGSDPEFFQLTEIGDDMPDD